MPLSAIQYILQLGRMHCFLLWPKAIWRLEGQKALNSMTSHVEGLKSSTITYYDNTSRLRKLSYNKNDVNLYQLKPISGLKIGSPLFFRIPLSIYQYINLCKLINISSHSIQVWSCFGPGSQPWSIQSVPPRFVSLPLSLSLVVAVHHRVDEWHPSAAAWLPPVPGGLRWKRWT